MNLPDAPTIFHPGGAGMVIAMRMLVEATRVALDACPYCGQSMHENGPVHLLFCPQRPGRETA